MNASGAEVVHKKIRIANVQMYFCFFLFLQIEWVVFLLVSLYNHNNKGVPVPTLEKDSPRSAKREPTRMLLTSQLVGTCERAGSELGHAVNANLGSKPVLSNAGVFPQVVCVPTKPCP